MQIKQSAEGVLIYAAMGQMLVGLTAALLRRYRLAGWIAAAACATLLGGWMWRWHQAGHIPMQNMFEVFLTLGLVLPPIGAVCRKWLDSPDRADTIGDMALGLIVLFPAGFVFSDQRQFLPPALQSPLFAPHVAVYMLSYALMAKAAIQAAMGWMQPSQSQRREAFAYKLICLGFPLLTLGLLLGSVWGKFAWGDWWGWDPKELWSLACWLVYAFYLHWRKWFRRQLISVNFAVVMMGFVFIIITLLWVNLSRVFSGMHNYAG